MQSAGLVDRPGMHDNPVSWQWRVTIPKSYFNAWVCVDGVGELRYQGQTYTISPGRAFVLLPGTPVEADTDGSGRLVNFSLHVMPRPRTVRELLERTPLLGVRFRDFPQVLEMARECIRLSHSREPLSDQLADLRAQLILAELWRDAHFARVDSTEDKLVALTTEIETRPDRDWAIDILAERLGLSRSQASLRFRAFTGQSPNRFVVGARLKRACELLRDSTMQVQEVAEAVGYRDVYFFSRQFRSKLGVSPSRWRQGN